MSWRWDSSDRAGVSYRGLEGGLLLGAVVAYTNVEIVGGLDGVGRLAVVDRYWAGFIRGDRVGGRFRTVEAAMAAVEAAVEAG